MRHCSTKNITYELSHELSNDLSIRILVNIAKISNMVGDKTLCLIFLPEIRLWYHWSKMTQKRVSKFSRPLRFCFISWHCFINFVRPCLSNHFFCNSSQSPANSNFSLLILLYLQSLAETCNENITCALYTKVLSLTVFCKHCFSCLIYRSKTVVRKLSTLVGGVFPIELSL